MSGKDRERLTVFLGLKMLCRVLLPTIPYVGASVFSVAISPFTTQRLPPALVEALCYFGELFI